MMCCVVLRDMKTTNKFCDFVYLYFKAFLVLLHFATSLTEPLRGVTIVNWPYANKLENGQFEGFCVDVLNEIARVARITYTLELAADGKYGGWLHNGSVDGMIGQVYRNNWPYANKLENGQFEGFCVDVLNEIARVARITYTLELAADGKYGGWLHNGSVDGMIGQVYRNETDFAIGDLTVLTNRASYVQFTFPFMEFGLSAIIHKNYSANITTFADLIQQTDIPYGVKKVGANLPLFSEDPVVSKMFAYFDSHPSSLVTGEKEGLKRVKTGKYAFITESSFNEYVANRDCDLAVIDDNRQHFKFEYAIAMQKGSKHHNLISNSLRHLKKMGKLKELKHKYWNSDNCLQTNDHSSGDNGTNSGGSHSREVRDDKKKKSDKLKNKKSSSNVIESSSLLLLALFFIVPIIY